MTTDPEIRLIVHDDVATELCEELRNALPEAEVTLTRELPAKRAGLGRDATLHNLAEYAGIAVMGTPALRALAPVLIAHIRAKGRAVRITRPDGTSVDLDGQFTVEEVQAIVEQALGSNESASGE